MYGKNDKVYYEYHSTETTKKFKLIVSLIVESFVPPSPFQRRWKSTLEFSVPFP